MVGAPPPSTARALGFGLRGRCPRCGRGRLFDGFLEVTARCRACGLGFAEHDSGDGPAFVGVFVLGAVAVGLAWLLEFAVAPPTWVHMVLWPPLILGAAVLILRPLKGLTVALQFKFRSVEEPEGGGRS